MQSATFAHPVTLGAFAVMPDGALHPRQAGLRPALTFAWRGRACEAALQDCSVQLAAITGRIPSTAERHADRDAAFRAVASLPISLPRGWRAGLLPDHRVRLATATSFATAPTVIGIIAAMVRFVLVLDPYLDRLDAACKASPPGTEAVSPGGAATSPGMAKTCPG